MMTLSKPPIVFGILVVLLSGVLCLLALHPPKQEAPQKKESSRAPTEQPPREKHPPTEPEPIAIPPKPSPIAEATREKKEMARAQQLLASTNEQHRIEGLKLLGAFPSPINEVILVGCLRSQENPEIRSTAALSLSNLERPSASTIDTLLGALEDSSEDVRFSALATLEDYLILVRQDPAAQQRIREGLRAKLQSNRLQVDIQKDIDEIVHDR
jgi:hypothetical protein